MSASFVACSAPPASLPWALDFQCSVLAEEHEQFRYYVAIAEGGCATDRASLGARQYEVEFTSTVLPPEPDPLEPGEYAFYAEARSQGSEVVVARGCTEETLPSAESMLAIVLKATDDRCAMPDAGSDSDAGVGVDRPDAPDVGFPDDAGFFDGDVGFVSDAGFFDAGDAGVVMDGSSGNDATVVMDASPGNDAGDADSGVPDSGRYDCIANAPSLAQYTSVSAGADSTAVVRCDGCLPTSVVSLWGDHYNTECVPVVGGAVTPPQEDFLGFDVETAHGCGTTWDGRLYCGGHNVRGQLGVPTAPSTAGLTPLHLVPQVDGAWRSVSVGAQHTCAIAGAGTLWCFGSNDFGQLGDGTYTDRNMPIRVGSRNDWIQVSAGGDTTCGITSDSQLWCWGRDDRGQTGTDGDGTPLQTPTSVGYYEVASVGGLSTCAIQASVQFLRCWGDNTTGIVGSDPSMLSFSRVPQTVSTASFQSRWRKVSVGTEHACAIVRHQTNNTRSLYCWGSPLYGRLGIGPVQTGWLFWNVQRVGAEEDWDQVSAGHRHTCGLRQGNDELWCFGSNACRQVGVDPADMVWRENPVPVPMLTLSCPG